MLFKFFLIVNFIVQGLTLFPQNSAVHSFKKLSCPEKWWVIGHPFVAKRALKVSQVTRIKTDSIRNNQILNGVGNGDQVDAFRHTYWMASLKQNIGERKARRLGVAHEKGNKRDFKKGKDEDGDLPDYISSEMDLFNNEIGLKIEGEIMVNVVEAVENGKCKIIKTDKNGNFLDCEGVAILLQSLKGKWENNKCLVMSDD